MTEASMAVWGGRFKFADVSTTRHDFSRQALPGSYTRLQERVTSAPAAPAHFYQPRQRPRPKDTFVSPQPLILGSAHQRPCPIGCPCNQSDRVLASYEPHDLDNALRNCNRWCSTNQESNYNCGPTTSSYSQYKNTNQLRHYQNNPTHRPNGSTMHRPMSHYIVRPPPPNLRERPFSSPHNANSYIPARTQPIPPRNGIPVGWGNVDLNTVYLEHYTDPHTISNGFAQSSYVPMQHQRPESPPRWETSYSAFCRNLLQVTRAF